MPFPATGASSRFRPLRKPPFWLLWTLLFFLFASKGEAQKPCNDTSISFSVTPSTIAFPTPTSSELSAGYSAEVGITATISDPCAADNWDMRVAMSTTNGTHPDTLEAYNADAGFQTWTPTGNWDGTTASAVLIDTGSGSTNAVFSLRYQLGDAADGSYSAGVVFHLVNKTTGYTATGSYTATIDIIRPVGVGGATFTISTTTPSLGTAATAQFQAGASSTGTVTVTVSDDSSEGTTLYVGAWDPYANPIAATLQARVDAGTWTSLEPRGAYAVSKACTTTCTQTWDFRKLLTYTGDPPSSQDKSQIRFELRNTADGTVIQTQNADLDLTVGKALSLSIDLTSIPFGTLSSGGAHTYDTALGVKNPSNLDTDLFIQGDAAYFTSQSGANNTVLPISRLEWQDADRLSGWNALSTTATKMNDLNLLANDGSVNNLQLLFRIQLLSADPKDTYTASFTISVVESACQGCF